MSASNPVTQTELTEVVLALATFQKRPLAVILAGHNGSGKSTLWYKHLANSLQMPLVNADRMMLSILPETNKGQQVYCTQCKDAFAIPDEPLPGWAEHLRDNHSDWMVVAQKGVEAFVAQAMERKVPFAMETVFSHWKSLGNGKFESKIDKIQELQKQGYFVLLLFVGLTDAALSISRVETRVAQKGHSVPPEKLISRFPRTQAAIHDATKVADVSVLVDNSRTIKEAFTLCRIQVKQSVIYDLRWKNEPLPCEIEAWMSKVCPSSSSEPS